MLRPIPERAAIPDAARAMAEALREAASEPPSTELLIDGRPGGERRIGLVLKRTYRIAEDGHCELADDAAQEPVSESESVYDEVDAPRCSPVCVDDDSFGFRPRCDVVLQGAAYTHSPHARSTQVSIKIGQHRRDIDVHGDRVLEKGPTGEWRFSEAEPFERMPLRYERAYGGVDRVAWERYGLPPEFEAMMKARPEYELDRQTPYHYPRNPSGCGFLVEGDPESLASVTVPNLEYAFDPVTPERLSVGRSDRWGEAPIPAGVDWFARSWFPRSAFVGRGHAPRVPGGYREQQLGWLPEDFQGPPRAQAHSVRPEYFQGASPGFSFDDVGPLTPVELHHVHPEHLRVRFELPDDVPHVAVSIRGPSATVLEPRPISIVIRPDLDELVITWCASARVDHPYTPEQALEWPRRVEWRSARGLA